MAGRVGVRGGPFDGASVAIGGRFRWLSEAGGHSNPAPGRALYVLASGGYRSGRRYERAYEFAGGNGRWCATCKVVIGRRHTDPSDLTCPVCSSQTTPTTQPKES